MKCAYFLVIITVQIVLISCSIENVIIRDYFSYKKVKRIVSFPCSNIDDDVKLARVFNDMYITYTSIWDVESSDKPRVDLEKVLNADYHRLGIFLDTRCESRRFSKIFVDATRNIMYDEMHNWLILSTNLSQSLETLNDEAFSVSTDFVIAIPSSRGYTLHDVYNPCKYRGGSMNVTLFGTWSSERGLTVRLNRSKFERRSNLHGIRLKVGVVVSSKPENMSLHDMMLEYNMKAKYGRTKFLYVLLLHLANIFNFTMDVVQINTQRRFDNSGPVFSAFKRKLIDLSASPVAMKVDRLNNADIIAPVWPMRSSFMFRTISSTKMKTAQFLKPLNVKVWYVILGMIGIATFVLILLLRLEDIHSPAENYGISVLLTIGALSQQGSAFVPTHYAGRIAFLQILLFSLLILNYYSASVVSDRLRNIGEKMNDSLISLAKSNMKIAVEPTPYIRSFLQVPDKEVKYFYNERWTKIPESNRYLPLEEGLDRVAEGRLAYHAMVDSAYPYIERTFKDRSICELTEVHLFRTTLAFHASHNSPFTELLKIGMNKIYDVGIRKRQLKRWSARKPFCPSNLLIAEPLSIHEAAPAFIFLCLCTALSLVICIVENILFCVWPTRVSSSIIEKRHLIVKSINMPSLRDVNLQALKNFNVIRDRMNIPNT